MSFILDALRKSENERREQTAPTLAAAPQAAPVKKRTVWLPILVIVLAINAIVFGALVLTRDKPAPAAVPATPPKESRALPMRKDSVVKPTPAPIPKAPAVTPAPVRRIAPPAPVTAPARLKTIEEGLPSFAQARATGLVSVGDLRVDMHVYSGDAAKRFVFVNMKKYREGDRLAEGPTIEEITPEGIIMSQQGTRFQLDRD